MNATNNGQQALAAADAYRYKQFTTRLLFRNLRFNKGAAAPGDRFPPFDLAESEGLRPAYSCRSGICQTCSTGIVAGGVDYLESPMATPGPGEALLCCSYPTLSPGEEEVVLNL